MNLTTERKRWTRYGDQYQRSLDAREVASDRHRLGDHEARITALEADVEALKGRAEIGGAS